MAPTSRDLLGTYLNDHLGGASTGVELARQLDEDGGTTLAKDIDQDRTVLRELIERLGAGRNPVKQAAGWVAEKAHRVAVSGPVTGDPALGLLLTAESLAVGIEGKAALWTALRELVPSYPQLADLGLDDLLARARDQRARVEAVRLDAARRAFGTAG